MVSEILHHKDGLLPPYQCKLHYTWTDLSTSYEQLQEKKARTFEGPLHV